MASDLSVQLFQASFAVDKDGIEAYLRNHPNLTKNPTEEYWKSHPAENAEAALWGKVSKLYSPEAYDKMQSLAKQFDIPPSGMPDIDIPGDPETRKAWFQYEDIKSKWGTGSPEAHLLLGSPFHHILQTIQCGMLCLGYPHHQR
jgi:hypothetical protein